MDTEPVNANPKMDSLGRQKEVVFVCSLLRRQSSVREDRSFVLSLDAEYGVGKSFFLDLLEQSLNDTNPVAKVDAWADDSGNEPSVAIMAAIEDALARYLAKPTAKDALEKLEKARRNILPILAKGAGGALSKAIARYVGDVVADELRLQLGEGEEDTSQKVTAVSEGVKAGAEAIGARLTELADQHAKAMLVDYRKRKRSRDVFKASMAELISGLSMDRVGLQAPLVVIVDELDRCRPDYAIKVLEEIKHFFDVPGVVFVLAMHKEQLSKSIRAVYGPDFESDEYLRRFYDLAINLQLRDFTALVSQQIDELAIDPEKFRWPPASNSPHNDPSTLPAYFALLFQSLSVTTREAKAVMRFIALFADLWDHPSKIEVTCLVPEIWAQLKGKRYADTEGFQDVKLSDFGGWIEGSGAEVAVGQLYAELRSLANQNLLHSQHGPKNHSNCSDYLRLVFASEFKALGEANKESGQWSVPSSSITEYQRCIQFLDQLVD